MSRSITWLGHATVRLDLGGVGLVTDPLSRARVVHLTRRVPLPPPASTRGLDAVLISHVHRDHLDLPSLRTLGLPIVAPRGAARLLDDVAHLDPERAAATLPLLRPRLAVPIHWGVSAAIRLKVPLPPGNDPGELSGEVGHRDAGVWLPPRRFSRVTR